MSWKTIRLGDCCTKIGSGATPKGGAVGYIDTGVTFIRSHNVYNLHFDDDRLTHVTDDAAKKLNGVTVFEGDVLLNITGDSVARTCVVPRGILPARVNQHVAIIRPDTKILDNRFLNYYLASPYMQAFMLGLAVGKGASRNAMTKDMIANYEVPCPSIETQRCIADILSSYDNLIENNQKQIKLLEEAAQRLYKEWFVDLRFPGYEDSKIVDGVPEGWSKGRADAFFNITIGKTPPRAEHEWFTKKNDGIPWVSIADMGNSTSHLFETKESLTHDAIKRHNIKVVPAGTVLLSFKLTVGRVSITTSDMCTNEAIAHFYMPDDYFQGYTYCYLKNFHYDELGSTSSISKAVNSKIIKSMPFIMPTEDLLKEFSKIVSPIFDMAKNKAKTVIMTQQARDRLLPKLMNGEIEV